MPARSSTEKCVVSSGSGAGVAPSRSFPSSALLEACSMSIEAATCFAWLFDVSRATGIVDEIRIAEEAGAIEIGAAHRFDLRVQRGRGQQAFRTSGSAARGC